MLVRWNLLNNLNSFEKDIQDFLNDARWKPAKWKPAVNLYKDDKNTTIEVELPGLDVKDIDVTTNNGILIVKGEKKISEGSRKYFKMEGFDGSFKRSFTLPYDTDVENIDAQYKNGVLVINIPKSLDKSKRVEVKSSN